MIKILFLQMYSFLKKYTHPFSRSQSASVLDRSVCSKCTILQSKYKSQFSKMVFGVLLHGLQSWTCKLFNTSTIIFCTSQYFTLLDLAHNFTLRDKHSIIVYQHTILHCYTSTISYTLRLAHYFTLYLYTLLDQHTCNFTLLDKHNIIQCSSTQFYTVRLAQYFTLLNQQNN